ncbi:hypothetical protein ATK74_0044 [Propionicimonas paludicola]|uniref:Uncharacterized protein n=1 Tax=Propionicimonas paludicola TaxID=185243 RepID=A0A2A9CM99_9ACTN|nr:hypothetical protein ATK74_0044 [Propionicimonas paludicola]
MNIQSADPRDISWEVLAKRYRVYIWNARRSQSTEFEITDCPSVSQAIDWASAHCPGGHHWYLYAVVSAGTELGLVLLQEHSAA